LTNTLRAQVQDLHEEREKDVVRRDNFFFPLHDGDDDYDDNVVLLMLLLLEMDYWLVLNYD
jgi:hypothetical protein